MAVKTDNRENLLHFMCYMCVWHRVGCLPMLVVGVAGVIAIDIELPLQYKNCQI